MARSQRRADANGVQITAAYVCSGSSKPPSMLFSMLPAIVQSRLPKLRSIRHSVIELRTGSESDRCMSPSSTGTSTPQSRPQSISDSVRGGSPSVLSYDEDVHREHPVSHVRSLSSSSTLPVFPMTEGNSGINWKYATQGSNLLNQAFEESSATATFSDNKAPTFCRDLYIHALTYLLRALPNDLNQTELLSIQTSLPTPIVESIGATASQKALVPYSGKGETADDELAPAPPSIIQRAVAAVIIQFFVFVQFILPYIKVFLASVYRYERQHHISERVFSMSIDTIDGIGKRSLRIADRVCAMNDGKVGQAINHFVIWWVTSVTGGIHQGIKQGVIVLREDSRRGNPVDETDNANGN